MIDIKQGIITLCESEFQITADTTPQALTEAIPALITHIHPVGTGYTHYSCWLDIEPQCYLWASVCFHGDALESIRLFPQHQSATAPAPRPIPWIPNHPISSAMRGTASSLSRTSCPSPGVASDMYRGGIRSIPQPVF